MGAHAGFDRRCPLSLRYFEEDDYREYPENQRSTRADYDNSVRYSDFVVDSIFSIVSQRDAIVIYGPDHGIDIFESNPDLACHSRNSDPVSVKAALDIPFLIYMTPLFRENHAEFAQRAMHSVDQTFDLENIIYLMMDIMQCDFEKPVVAKKSLARKQ